MSTHKITPKEVTGDFEKALQELIFNVQQGNLSSASILSRWDRTRGTDWFVGTRAKPIQDWQFPEK